MARPLFFADPSDTALRREDHAFLLGGDVMVRPALLERGVHDFAVPQGRPFTLAGEDPLHTPAHPVLRLRPGAILPVGPGGQAADDAFAGALTLLVSLDEHGRACGQLYEDAGDGYGYRNGDHLVTTYEAVHDGNEVDVRIVDRRGAYQSRFDALHVELL